MKKILVLTLVLGLTVASLPARPAAAHRVHFGIGLGFWVPPVYFSPPSVVYPRPDAYSPPPYDNSYREWVPGHWESRSTPEGTVREWIPGHWLYR
jgi:hypothetical protein